MADMPRFRATRNDGDYDHEIDVESFLDNQKYFSLIQEKTDTANSYSCFISHILLPCPAPSDTFTLDMIFFSSFFLKIYLEHSGEWKNDDRNPIDGTWGYLWNHVYSAEWWPRKDEARNLLMTWWL
jgi:hypothetical protein